MRRAEPGSSVPRTTPAGQRARPQYQPALPDADPVLRRELWQIGHRELHGAGDVEDRLVPVPEVVGVAHRRDRPSRRTRASPAPCPRPRPAASRGRARLRPRNTPRGGEGLRQSRPCVTCASMRRAYGWRALCRQRQLGASLPKEAHCPVRRGPGAASASPSQVTRRPISHADPAPTKDLGASRGPPQAPCLDDIEQSASRLNDEQDQIQARLRARHRMRRNPSCNRLSIRSAAYRRPG